MIQFSSVHSVMSNFLWPHGVQHARPPCPSPTPRVYPNLCPLSQWCHPTISSSVVPFSSCLQSSPASGSFQICRWPKYWSFSFSISPSNEHSGLISFRMEWLDLLAVQGILKSLLQHDYTVLFESGQPICALKSVVLNEGKMTGRKWQKMCIQTYFSS